MRRIAYLAAFVLACASHAPASAAPITAYDNAAVFPNQFFGNSLGLDFNVNQTIQITSLGAFFGNNINFLLFQSQNGVQVGIYDRNTQALISPTVFVSPTTFTSIQNGNAFVALAEPFVLAPGQYSVVAFNDPNLNSFGLPNTTSTTDTGGGLISFVGGGRFGFSAGAFPTNVDGGPANRYNAGTFQFEAFVPPVPEPASITVLGLGVAGLLGYRLRRKSAAVSETT